MKAYLVDQSVPGGARSAEVAEPVPKPDEAVLAVEAFSINHGELPQSGMFAPGTALGWDAAGRIVAAAVDGSGPASGARVVSQDAGGAWAERRAVSTSRLAVLPADVDAESASALPVAGATALQALRVLGGCVGRRVLITGSNGGVGRFAVQLARRAGAWVVALTSTLARRDELMALGANEVITDLATLVEPVFGVIENVGGETLVAAWGHLRPGGSLVSIGYAGGQPATFPPYGTVGPPRTLLSFQLGNRMLPGETLGEDLGYLAGLVAAKQLDPQITWRGTWAQVPEALELLATRKISGKAVIRVD